MCMKYKCWDPNIGLSQDVGQKDALYSDLLEVPACLQKANVVSEAGVDPETLSSALNPQRTS